MRFSRGCLLPSSVRGILVPVLTALAACLPLPASAADSAFVEYPVKPIRILVAASPGTADDFFARTLAQELAGFYNQRVVVDNRAGAGGLIGNKIVSLAAPDGYTLGMVSVTRLITELIREEPPYRSLADIVGVAQVASITNVLVTGPRLHVRTAADFVAYARVRPGELNYASLGTGSASHLAGELFTRALRVDAVHIPFSRLPDSYVEMMLGRVQYAVHTLPAVLGVVRKGRLRALAVMSRERSPTLPWLPSIAESGLPEAQFDRWSGVVAPRGTPRRIVEQLHGDIVRALRSESLRDLFVRQGAESTPESTPDGFMRLMQQEYLHYEALMRSWGLRRQGSAQRPSPDLQAAEPAPRAADASAWSSLRAERTNCSNPQQPLPQC
jgi:tripartite-type tricarboxylate transporter receptor subunit TctC